MNCLSLWLLFFRWFPHGMTAACEKLPDKITFKSLVYSLNFVYLIFLIFHSACGTSTQLKILINVWKWTETGAGAGPMKTRAREPEPHSWKPGAPELEPCPWKEELRSRSCVIFTTDPQPWSNPHCSRAHSWSRAKI